MKYDFSFLSVNADSPVAQKAAKLFGDEIELRAGYRPFEGGEPCVELIADDTVENKDSFSIEQNGCNLKITAQGIRGLIYGYSDSLCGNF